MRKCNWFFLLRVGQRRRALPSLFSPRTESKRNRNRERGGEGKREKERRRGSYCF